MDPTIAANRAHWNATSNEYQASHDPAIGSAPKLWGVHALPDDVLGALGPTAGLEVLEFGCGAGQWAAALVEEGAEVVGIDLSERQLAHARHRRGDLRLVQAAGQYLPFAPSSFDVVFCDHGAMSWADPTATVPEVTRVLRPGGRFVFNVTSPVLDMCWDDEVGGPGRLVRADYFGLHRDVDQDGATSYSLGYGEWIRLFRASGLAIEDLIEPRPASVRPNTYWNSDPPDWFRRWPGESIWITRLES